MDAIDGQFTFHAAPPPVPRRRRWLAVWVALAVALVFPAIQLAVLFQWADYWLIVRRQLMDEYALEKLHHFFEDYRAEHHEWPDDLAQVDDKSYFLVDEHERPTDYFGNPIHYVRTDDGYWLSTWGADGKPGGVGEDYDYSEDGRGNRFLPPPGNRRLRLGQFARWILTAGNIAYLVVTTLAALAAIVALVARRPLMQRQSLARVVLYVAVSAGAALVVGFVLMVFNAPPNYH